MAISLNARDETWAINEALKHVKHPTGVFEVQGYVSVRTYEKRFAVFVCETEPYTVRRLLGNELTIEETMALIRMAGEYE